MNGKWTTGNVVSLALLASLVGHFAIQRYFERRSPVEFEQVNSHLALVPCAELSSNDDAMERLIPSLPQLQRMAQPRQQVIPVHNTQEEELPRKAQHGAATPTTVPVPADTLPAETSSDDRPSLGDENLAQVREVIDHELATSSLEERDIWFEELKSLPAGVVADLLQVRRQLHSLPKLMGGMPDKLASTDSAIVPRTQETIAEPVSQRIHFNVYDQHFATEALETAVSQLRHNLVNAATPGYKRLRVTLVDVYNSRLEAGAPEDAGSGAADDHLLLGEGCRVGPVFIDLKPGIFKKTGRSLDLAIEGHGFFVVSQGGKQFLTRCGTLTLDRDRQLCLAVSSEPAVLQPAIKVPEAATEILISEDGVVRSLESESGPLTELGHLQLATVASPARLKPVGNMLLLANEESGLASVGESGASGRGIVRQGFVELSNVDIEVELSEIEEISQILKAIPQQSSRSATARNPRQNLNR